MIRQPFAAMLILAAGLSTPALAQSAGEPPRAPNATAGAAGRIVATTPAARTKARRGRSKAGGCAGGTAGTGASGSDATSGSGSAAPGGPGSPPPVLPTPTPGSGANPPAPTGPGEFALASLMKV